MVLHTSFLEGSGEEWKYSSIASLVYMYRGLARCLLVTFCVSSAMAASQKFGGIQVNFEYELNSAGATGGNSGTNVQARFRVLDPKSAYPIAGLHPLAWFRARGPGVPNIRSSKDCIAAARLLVGSRGNTVSSTVGLNGFELVTLNTDHTVAILDPKINLATSNLIALIKLPSAASGWDIDSESGVIAVAMPERRTIALVDLNRRRLSEEVPTGKGAQVLRVNKALHQLWFASETPSTITVAELPSGRNIETFRIDNEVSEIGFERKGEYAWIVSEHSGNINFYNARTLKSLGTFSVGSSGLLTAYSHLAGALYVANTGRGEIFALYPEKARLGAKLTVGLGITSVAMSPDGKFLFAVKAGNRAVAIIDTSSNRILQEFETGRDPDHIGFTKNFAYIRNAGESTMTAIQLPSNENTAGTRSALTVPIGVGSPNSVTLTATMSPFTAVPDQEQMTLVMNPADKAIYWYMEGMMAPQNSFKTYTATPRSVLVHNRGLNELATGSYHAIASLPGPGKYDVVFAVDSPRVVTCFQATIKGTPTKLGEAQKPQFVSKFARQSLVENVPTKLRFALVNPATKKLVRGASDIRVLTYLDDGRYQMRGQAQPLKNGGYQTSFTFPAAGRFLVMIESAELGLKYGDYPGVFAIVAAQAAPGDQVARGVGR
jgi:DNA-binding beta-propeller fold protein YncE